MVSDALEALINKAIRNGFLGLNLNKGWEDDKWHVTYRNTDTSNIQSFKGVDPIETMKMALRAGIRDVAAAAPAGAVPKKTRVEDDLI